MWLIKSCQIKPVSEIKLILKNKNSADFLLLYIYLFIYLSLKMLLSYTKTTTYFTEFHKGYKPLK